MHYQLAPVAATALLIIGLALSVAGLGHPDGIADADGAKLAASQVANLDTAPARSIASAARSRSAWHQVSATVDGRDIGAVDLAVVAIAPCCAGDARQGHGDLRAALSEAAAVAHRHGPWYDRTSTQRWINAPIMAGSTSPRQTPAVASPSIATPAVRS